MQMLYTCQRWLGSYVFWYAVETGASIDVDATLTADATDVTVSLRKSKVSVLSLLLWLKLLVKSQQLLKASVGNQTSFCLSVVQTFLVVNDW